MIKKKKESRVMEFSKRHSGHWHGICAAFLATVFLLATGRGNELVWVPGRVFWDSSSPNWSRVSSPDDNLQWESGSDAIFGEETGIVFLGSSQIDVSSLSFSETATIAGGSLNFTGSSRIDAGNNETVYIDSAISGSNGLLLGSRSEGVIIISGSNSFEGVTTVNSGTWLGVESDTALGWPGEGTVIRSGATLALGDVNITGEEITIAGNGASSALGAIHQGGNIPRASLSGSISLSQDSKVGSAGQLDLDGPVNTNGEELTLSASRSGQIQVNGSILGSNLGEGNNVTFEGGGLVVLRNSNTYEGATLINGGTTLSVQAANGLPGLSGRSALIMDDLGEGGSSLLIGQESDQVVSLLDGSTTSSIILNSDLTVGHVGIGTPSNFQGVIEGNGSVIKDGINTQELSGPNIYDGDTTVRSGVLVVSNPSGLGSSVRGAVVETGATLILDDVSIADEAMVISGHGDIGQGALVGAGEVVSLGGPISLAGDSTIYGSTGTTLSLGGAVDRGVNELEIRSDGTIDINGSLFGGTNDRDPRLVFSGGGNVNLNTAGGSHGTIEITESVLVNANAFGSLSALGGPNPLVMNPNGVGGAQLNLAGNSQAVASMEGASTSQILLGGNNINVGFDPSTQAIGTQSADFGGSVKGVGEIHKIGLSNQMLSGESDFEGLTYVHEGTLTIGHDMALGSSLTPGSETRVSGEAGLALQGGIQTDERVLLFNNANLINNFGTNTISNLLLVEHDIDGPGVGDKLARIGALGGQLNLSGGIDDNAARFSSNPEMNLALNTGANDDGSIHIDSVIDSSIR
ncbi:autotransporter-associated beta strand repeat-containing protein, partial [Akkermansiaceae bacterium]|nr:autotransporter-associated beta strand repeat-containing protein [Akkermansiaceae bacterium]